MPKFIMRFWSDWRRKWIEFEVECPQLGSIAEYAECITRKLGEEYEKAMYRNCVRRGGDPQLCRTVASAYRRNYEEKLLPEVEVLLETEIPRRQAKKRMERLSFIGPDVFAKLQQRVVALAQLGKCMERYGKNCRMGISSDRIFMLDTDSRKKEALKELIMIGRFLAKQFGVRSVIYPTRRGFHLLALDPLRKDVIESLLEFLSGLYDEGKLKYIDPVYLAMVRARGFFTLTVGKGRDLHYAVVPVGEGERRHVVLFYSPIAMYLRSVVPEVLLEFDEVYPVERWEEWRAVREEYLRYLKEVSGAG